ncbi:hypothetical protein ACI6PS_10325 [Flavobacterium sp. PLA-1-15]|uniref:hypothetical protein n=1 Tax=Flavobacterium sp. PLA-1-15 TaxID=3380533 RepID=UPI003B822457
MKWRGITVSYPKEVILIKITCIAWLIAKIISFKVWTIDRYFPVAPVFDFLSFPNQFHLILYAISLIGIASIFLFPNEKIILIGVIILELFSCSLDYMRWQPWEYQYLLTLVFFLFAKDRKKFLSLFTFLLAATYVFSGIHKFSGSFLYTFWDKIVLYRLFGLSYSEFMNPLYHYSGLMLSVVEVAIGVGILFVRTRKYFALVAIIMHLIIVLIFGPSGLNYNIIIFPWNLAMMALVGVLFYKNAEPNFSLSFFRSKLNVGAFLFVGVMPVLCLFGKWDDYLSFNLYSGNIKTLVVCVEDLEEYPELKPYQSTARSSRYCNDSYLINTTTWALDELKVAVYPEERVFRKLQESFEGKYPKVKKTFVYYTYPYGNKNIRLVE